MTTLSNRETEGDGGRERETEGGRGRRREGEGDGGREREREGGREREDLFADASSISQIGRAHV